MSGLVPYICFNCGTEFELLKIRKPGKETLAEHLKQNAVCSERVAAYRLKGASSDIFDNPWPAVRMRRIPPPSYPEPLAWPGWWDEEKA